MRTDPQSLHVCRKAKLTKPHDWPGWPMHTHLCGKSDTDVSEKAEEVTKEATGLCVGRNVRRAHPFFASFLFAVAGLLSSVHTGTPTAKAVASELGAAAAGFSRREGGGSATALAGAVSVFARGGGSEAGGAAEDAALFRRSSASRSAFACCSTVTPRFAARRAKASALRNPIQGRMN